MARYKVGHDLDRTFIGKGENGNWDWVPYAQAFKFANYFRAKEALLSMPDEKRMYGFSYRPKCIFMKVEYTEAEKAMPGNEWMRDTGSL